MRCLHPFCPMGGGLNSWDEVLAHPEAGFQPEKDAEVAKLLAQLGPPPATVESLTSSATLSRVVELCPCLYSQLPLKVTARGVVHLCEVTLGTRVDSATVLSAFKVQHPGKPQYQYKFPPLVPGAGGGDIMEALCGEVLTNHGIPHMATGVDDWPVWASRAHISLNRGKYSKLKLYGDFLIPCAPHNLLVSVKSEAARERFLVSGNRLESIGFGFFSDASEFWTESRMNLLKRWGFIAVYMPADTLSILMDKLAATGRRSFAINVNGKELFRPLDDFGGDIGQVAGRLSLGL